VIYVTRSIHPQENEQAVNSAVKWFRENSENSRPFRVCPPTLPLLSTDIQKKDGAKKQLMSTQSLKHNFLRMRQNPQMNGCFIAVLVREVIFNCLKLHLCFSTGLTIYIRFKNEKNLCNFTPGNNNFSPTKPQKLRKLGLDRLNFSQLVKGCP